MNFTIEPMDEDAAREILAWHYEAPHDFYNADPAELEEDVEVFTNPAHHYYTIQDELWGIAGFCYFGADAQVRGGSYPEEYLDIGIALRPELVGRGFGGGFFRAVLEFAKVTFPAQGLRATVASFNLRAIHICLAQGFERIAEFSRLEDGQQFVILRLRV